MKLAYKQINKVRFIAKPLYYSRSSARKDEAIEKLETKVMAMEAELARLKMQVNKGGAYTAATSLFNFRNEAMF